jgi:alpha-1,2-mannosyltransferase
MVNSSWTRAHVLDVLSYSSSTYQLLSSIVTLAFPPVLLTSFLVRRAYAAIDGRRGERPEVTTVFPPCDTRALAEFKLDSREPIVLSIAQFRCIHAFSRPSRA